MSPKNAHLTKHAYVCPRQRQDGKRPNSKAMKVKCMEGCLHPYNLGTTLYRHCTEVLPRSDDVGTVNHSNQWETPLNLSLSAGVTQN